MKQKYDERQMEQYFLRKGNLQKIPLWLPEMCFIYAQCEFN